MSTMVVERGPHLLVSLGLTGTQNMHLLASPKQHFPEERPSYPDYPTCFAWLHRLKCVCLSSRGPHHHAIPCSKASHGSVHGRNGELSQFSIDWEFKTSVLYPAFSVHSYCSQCTIYTGSSAEPTISRASVSLPSG